MRTEKRFLIGTISRQLSVVIFLISILFIAGSCNKDDDDSNNNTVTFLATLNGASEVPPNASAATGNATLTYNRDTKIFSIVVNYSGITATASHIHKGEAGQPGGVVFPFNPPLTSPINYTSAPLDDAQEADLMANMYFVNVHSAQFPGGEIRGQLEKK